MISPTRLWSLVVTAFLVVACCRDDPRGLVVATLTDGKGKVEAIASPASHWEEIEAGFAFHFDDAVRTGPQATASLVCADGGHIRMAENSLLHFLRGQRGRHEESLLNVALGEAELEAVGALIVITRSGRAEVAPGTRLVVRSAEKRDAFEVLVGHASLMPTVGDASRPASEGVDLTAGQGAGIDFGKPIFEPYRIASRSRQGPVAQPSIAQVTAEAGAAEGSPSGSSGPPPETEPPLPAVAPVAPDDRRADVTMDAGEKLVFHDSRKALLVRLRVGDACPAGGYVEADGHRSDFKGSAALLRLARGKHAYRVRCLGDRRGETPRKRGVLTLLNDSGEVPLNRNAPSNTIAADGRRYTILFQSRLPAFVLRWTRKSPEGKDGKDGSYELHVVSGDRTRTFDVQGSEYRLSSGALGEGEHTWWFSSAADDTSPKTRIAVVFDNTAPTAQFFRAENKSRDNVPAAPSPGALAVDGVTVEGAHVSASGKSLTVDNHGRFRAEVTPLEGDEAVAVRIDLPRGESHCYVRRPRGGP